MVLESNFTVNSTFQLCNPYRETIAYSLGKAVSAIAFASEAGNFRCFALLVGASFKKGYWLIPTTSASRVIETKFASDRLLYFVAWLPKLMNSSATKTLLALLLALRELKVPLSTDE